MHRRLTISVLMFVSLLSAAPSAFASDPVIAGQVSGIELCPQFICGSAIFSGVFQGAVDGKPTKAVFSVSVNHEALPGSGETAAITDGSWFIRTKRQVFYGGVTTGTITNNGDNTFTVTAELALASGGTGTLYFSGILDHNDFPPTIFGTMSQSA